MSSETLNASSDYSIGSGVTKTPSGDSASTILSDGSDSTYLSFSSTGPNTYVYVTLSALTGVASISAASITLRALQTSTKSQSFLQARLYKSDGVTGLCNAISGEDDGFGFTSSFSNLAVNCGGLDTTVSDWNGAILFFSGQNDGYSNTFEVSAASVTLTVTLATDTGDFCSENDASSMWGTSLHRIQMVFSRLKTNALDAFDRRSSGRTRPAVLLGN